jgi:predicted rRNA methylase YqxC with S4 and FtsJ domains
VEIFKALCEKGICVSFAEAKRRVMSNTISVNGSPATLETTVKKGDTIKVRKGIEISY